MRLVSYLTFCSLMILSPAITTYPQAAKSELVGEVRDQNGALVPNAKVTLTDAATGQTSSKISSDGLFIMTNLKPGLYNVAVEAQGFKQSQREGVRLATGERVRIDVVLDPGAVTELVTVVQDASLLRTESGGLGQVISNRKIVDIPLNGRNFLSLVTLSAGVAQPPPTTAGPSFPRINGGRPRTNEYLFDGISVLQPEPGQVAYFPVIDAIDEFKVETNSVPAEFGRFNGGVINLTTKSGTTARHGDLFESLRHEALNARNYFQPAPAAKPEYRRSQFGGTAGGPLVRDRTFFFVDYQGQRQGIGRTAISTVPTLLQRQGVFSEAIAGRVPSVYDPSTTAAGTLARSPFPGNAIPADRIDPVASALLQCYPLPTSAGTANNYRRTAIERDDQDQWDARLDHGWATGRDSAFVRFTQFNDRFLPVAPLPDGSGVTSGTLGPQDTHALAMASNYRHTFSEGLLNELRVGDSRRHVTRDAATLAATATAALGLPGLPSTARFPTTLPTFLVSGYQQLGSPPNTASNFRTSVTELADSVTWLAGRHTLKFGADWRWERLDVIQPPSPTGSFTFNAIGSDLCP